MIETLIGDINKIIKKKLQKDLKGVYYKNMEIEIYLQQVFGGERKRETVEDWWHSRRERTRKVWGAERKKSNHVANQQ